jgi:hypothetical protein
MNFIAGLALAVLLAGVDPATLPEGNLDPPKGGPGVTESITPPEVERGLSCAEARAQLHLVVRLYRDWETKVEEATVIAPFLNEPQVLRMKADLLEEQELLDNAAEFALLEADKACAVAEEVNYEE